MNKKMHGRENDSVEVVDQPQKSDVALREEAMLAFWQEHDIFKKSLETPAGSKPVGDFVFYDGPPFATGLPHFGHILPGTIKDAVPRFWTMNGYRVRRQWGWDCHGLPLENLIEKELGLATKKDIEEFGIKNFNEKARSVVLRYADDWKRIIPRMGRFVDMENDYRTMDSTYTESVWWVFKTLFDKGLVTEGFKSMHLCPRCGTTLSNFEVNQGYKDIKDIAVTVKLPLLDDSGAVTDTSLLVWTTTPWTLPGNLAAAVHNEAEYVKVLVKTDESEEKMILAKGRLVQLGDLEHEVQETMKGSDLVGRRYQPPFDYLKDQDMTGKENAWTVYHADYVEIGEEGTGAVHLAPAFGEDDMVLAQEHNVPIFHHVDEAGHFEGFVTDFAGQLVKPKDDEESGVTHLDTDIDIVRALNVSGKLLKKENITHSYPHCWRCDTPLLNYATTSWFVDVPSLKDKLIEENSKVGWVPGHVGKNRFGKWLEGARDWAISRQRYWGAPLPIWKNPETCKPVVLGSLEELKQYVPKSENTYLAMRHGESESNASGVVQTNRESANPLTSKGAGEVEKTAKDLQNSGITKIIASPFERTKQTAEMVADAIGVNKSQIVYDKRIQEIQIPELEGKPGSEYRSFIGAQPNWFTAKTEKGESWDDVRKRAGEFLYDLEQNYNDEKILIISHNSPLRMMQLVESGESFIDYFDHDDDGNRFNNAEIRELDFTPIPHNDNYELDFHRPYIDEINLYEDGVRLERIPDVFDCWFESGSMPYAQFHYPFSCDKKKFEKEHFPANFIAESIDQTRGWFYSLMVLGVALFDKSPFENVITNGLVLAEDGKKLSKKLQNYSAPLDLANQVGVDSMRFYLLSSPVIKGEDFGFSDKEVQELQRKNIGRLHNVLSMYEMFASDVEAGDDSKHVLDEWIITRLNTVVQEVTDGYKTYELDKATRPLTDLIDDLSVWYLRRSRDRLKGTDEKDKQAALATLRYTLRTLALVMAPVMPFYAEYLWQAIKEEKDVESVHLAKWPKAGKVSETKLEAMRTTREIVTSALESRTKSGIKVRQPIMSVSGPKLDEHLQMLVLDELNAKNYEVSDVIGIDTILTPELLAEGAVRELMRAVQSARKDADLKPSDDIELTIDTNESGKDAVEENKELLVSTVGAKELNFSENDGLELSAGDHKFNFSIRKI